MLFKYRLGLDMGATSIGWALYDLETNALIDCGVRIFDDGRENKSKASLCVKRRNARCARRMQNRKHIQKKELLKTLVQYDLFPKTKEQQQELKVLDPYALRAKALDEKIDLFELGRVIFHLVQRKGFLSNRKDNKEQGGKLKEGYNLLQKEMMTHNARTYGEYLFKLKQDNPAANLRLKKVFDTNGNFLGGLFPFRQTYKDEFNQIYDSQKKFYPHVLTDALYKKLEEILFFQRPLKVQEEGNCIFEEGEKRCPKAHPLFQAFRIWQHVLNLTFCPSNASHYEPLTKEHIHKLVEILQNPQSYIKTQQPLLTYSAVKVLLGLDKNGQFNFEKMTHVDSASVKGILVDNTQYAVSRTTHLFYEWKGLSQSQKEKIICVLSRPYDYIKFPKTKLSVELQDELIMKYVCTEFKLSRAAAEDLLYEVNLEDGFAALSEKALHKILPAMQQGMMYADACVEAGYHHSQKNYERLDVLPYYGELLHQSCLGQKAHPNTVEEKYGKINNATVHVALNQIRHLVNELIKRYGKPFDISIEYGRDLNASVAERKKMLIEQDKNAVENNRIVEELNKKIGERKWTKRDIEKYKIWKNMGTPKGESSTLVRECPFSGELISVSDLLNGERFQIEHLIPFSRSLDNTYHNRVIASVSANRYKGNRTPYEAFHESKDGYDWKEIQRRAKKLSMEQQWRFSKEAMHKFEQQEGPIARSLNDTRYMTRLLQAYLMPIVREDGRKNVQSIVGQLTAMIRKSWGLNEYKNKTPLVIDKKKGKKQAPVADDYRAYHTHHAIDAIIIAAVDRSQIQAVATQLKNVRQSVVQEFCDEFYKLKDDTVSLEEKTALRKRIKDFTTECERRIICQYIPLPKGWYATDILRQVKKINISHKPQLKDIKCATSTIGQLHEDAAYGLKSFVNDTSLEATFVSGVKNKQRDVTAYIPIFKNIDDKKAYYDAYKAWFMIEGKSNSLKAKTVLEKQIKENLLQKETQAIAALRQASQKAFKWYIGGGNYCAEIYQIHPQNKIHGVKTKNAGKWESEIISNYNATVRIRRGEEIFYWKNKYPNAKRIMTLKRNDMVVGTFTKEQAYTSDVPEKIQPYIQSFFEENPNLIEVDVLFRVKKMKSDGSIYLTPHHIAKEKDDTKSWCACASSLQKYRARKAFVSPCGRITYAK